MTLIKVESPYSKPLPSPGPAVARSSNSPWLWMTLACLLLGTSGGVRFWRDWKFAALATESDRPPFHLGDLPRKLGDWESDAGADGQLDDQVARIAGSNDSIVRTYLNKTSSDKVTALAIYGRADKVFGHSPDACYPAAGYHLVKGPVDREMSVPGIEGTVRYRWAIYMKRVGGIGYYQETCHIFFHDGEWLSEAASRWKSFRYHPSMYRILIDRPVSSLSETAYRPSEELLGALIREITERAAPHKVIRSGGAMAISASPAPGASPPQGGRPG